MALVNKPDESIFASSAKQGEVDNFPDLLRGWGITFDQTQGIPPMEWFNFLFKRLDEKHAYLMQRGLPEWSDTQDYTKGSCVQFDGVSYRALKNSKNNRPNESNSQYWVRWGFALSEIARATLTQYGVTQLYTGYDSQSEDLALTPKTGYQLKQLIDSNTRALGNVIPNSKKSSAVNSNSADTVATSAAVKTAYDKGVEAKKAADNANSNANGRVSKSGDTMNGMLTITNSSTTYRVNDYNWPKKIELSGDSVIGNEVSVIGFNNNGALHLGGKPNSSEFNASIDETGLWVKGDVVTKSGASLNNAFMKTGGVVTGDTSFKQGDWSGISFYNNSGRYVRVESNPHGSNSILSFVYRESNGSNINVASLPRKNGNILLDSDISHATNGTNKEKVASEFALGELYKQTVTDIRLGALATRKLGSGSWTSHGNGYVVVGFENGNWDALHASDNIHLRPIQKKVNGQWVTISNV